MSKHIIDQTYHKYLHNRASQIGVNAALQEIYAGKAQKDFNQIKNTEQKAEQKRIKDAEKAEQKRIKDAEKAEQKRIKDAEKVKQKEEQKRIKDVEKAEQKRIKDAEKVKQKAEQKRIKDAEKAEQKRIKDAEKAKQKEEQKRIKDAEKAEQKRIKDAEKAEQKRIKDAEKAKQKAEQKRIKDAEKDSKPKIHKRNVKESMKKQVASEQNWRCKKCGMSLPGNYEIDHVKPMKNGGVNDRINLQALCRNCHGEKTQREIAGIKQQKQLTMKQIFEQSGYTFAKDIRLRR